MALIAYNSGKTESGFENGHFADSAAVFDSFYRLNWMQKKMSVFRLKIANNQTENK